MNFTVLMEVTESELCDQPQGAWTWLGELGWGARDREHALHLPN